MCFLRDNPGASYHDLFDKAQEQIHDHTMFKTVRPSDCFAPQIDLLKVWHFDNRAKMTSLKALQVNMRSETVLEMPLPFDQPIAQGRRRHGADPLQPARRRADEKVCPNQPRRDQIPNRANGHARRRRGELVRHQNRFENSRTASRRRPLLHVGNGRREARKTRRERIALADIIFPYVRFSHPEFVRILTWMRGQVISEDEVTGKLKTKGVFTDVHATVGGLDFHFGTGGIHGCVRRRSCARTPRR
jgi:hypothetical protein